MKMTATEPAADGPIEKLAALFASHGGEAYGEDVTQLQHGLQCAAAAERDGASEALITAALLHDVGHMLHRDAAAALAAGRDDRHEVLGASFLARWFPKDVTEPIALHVAAKRYLCTMDQDYQRLLSPVSLRTLQLQGGPMDEREATTFAWLPHAGAAVKVRRWDEQAKTTDAGTPPLEHFLAIARRCLA